MKKFLSVLMCVVIMLSVLTSTILALETEQVSDKETENVASEGIQALFKNYYHGGFYHRNNTNYFKDGDSVKKLFVGGNVQTQKDTYFSGNWLWMDNNSGYKGNSIDQPTQHFTYVDGTQEYDPGTISGVNFYTMKWFAESSKEANWSLQDGFYVSTDSEDLKAALGFVASCFTNEGNALQLAKVAVKEEFDQLLFVLYAAGDANGLLTNTSGYGEYVISTAVITRMEEADISTAIAEELNDRTYSYSPVAAVQETPAVKLAARMFFKSVAPIADKTPNNEIKTLFEKYYNGGRYHRNNTNYFQANDYVSNMFVGGFIQTQKDTYFNNNWLWMDNNSGYKGDTTIAEPNQHFTYINEEQKNDWTMSGVHFYTMKWFAEEGYNNWTYDSNVQTYTSTDAGNLTAALGFVASCYTNVGTKALTLEKVVVKEESNQLVIVLYAAGDANGLLTNTSGYGEYVISTAVITRMGEADISTAIAEELNDRTYSYSPVAAVQETPAVKLAARMFFKSIGVTQAETPEEPVPTIQDLFKEYYNSGVYHRNNINYLKENPTVSNMFVGGVVQTQKDTYFNNNWLWMDNNSGYKGDTTIAEPNQHFTYINGTQVDDWTMSGVHFYTMEWFAEEGYNNWTYDSETQTYTSTDDKNLEATLGFVASCFKNDGDNPLELDRVTVSNSGDKLEFVLYAKDSKNVLSGNDLVIARAFVTKMTSDQIKTAIEAELSNN